MRITCCTMGGVVDIVSGFEWKAILMQVKRNRQLWLLLTAAIIALAAAYCFWAPGKNVTDGRHNHLRNGIWLQHGWLGDDGWFTRTGRDRRLFRNAERIRGLAATLDAHHIIDVFPHLCPCLPEGWIAPVDDAQTELFLDNIGNRRVIPWVGGVLGKQVFLESASWRANFAVSVRDLLSRHPRLAGIQINVEPLPSGNRDFLTLLDLVKHTLPKGKILSVAAYPPPTVWHPFPEIHWDRAYYGEVSRRCNQLAVMMYDTALISSKLYQNLMAEWTQEVLQWAVGPSVLLGVPAYDDAGVGYHHPRVENLENAILGVHAGLERFAVIPSNYQGIAVYCEWEMDASEWACLSACFVRGKAGEGH